MLNDVIKIVDKLSNMEKIHQEQLQSQIGKFSREAFVQSVNEQVNQANSAYTFLSQLGKSYKNEPDTEANENHLAEELKNHILKRIPELTTEKAKAIKVNEYAANSYHERLRELQLVCPRVFTQNLVLDKTIAKDNKLGSLASLVHKSDANNDLKMPIVNSDSSISGPTQVRSSRQSIKVDLTIQQLEQIQHFFQRAYETVKALENLVQSAIRSENAELNAIVDILNESADRIQNLSTQEVFSDVIETSKVFAPLILNVKNTVTGLKNNSLLSHIKINLEDMEKKVDSLFQTFTTLYSISQIHHNEITQQSIQANQQFSDLIKQPIGLSSSQLVTNTATNFKPSSARRSNEDLGTQQNQQPPSGRRATMVFPTNALPQLPVSNPSVNPINSMQQPVTPTRRSAEDLNLGQIRGSDIPARPNRAAPTEIPPARPNQAAPTETPPVRPSAPAPTRPPVRPNAPAPTGIPPQWPFIAAPSAPPQGIGLNPAVVPQTLAGAPKKPLANRGVKLPEMPKTTPPSPSKRPNSSE